MKLLLLGLLILLASCRGDLSFDTTQLPPEALLSVERGLSYWPSSGITLNGGDNIIITVSPEQIAPHRGYTNWDCTRLNGCTYQIRLSEELNWSSCIVDSIITHEFSHILGYTHQDPENPTMDGKELAFVLCD